MRLQIAAKVSCHQVTPVFKSPCHKSYQLLQEVVYEVIDLSTFYFDHLAMFWGYILTFCASDFSEPFSVELARVQEAVETVL